MCGRFYIDDDLKEDLDSLLKDLNQKLKDGLNYKAGEVFPTNHAVVLVKDKKHAEVVKWRYPGWKNKGVIFNARSESVLQKKMFEKGFTKNRCLIPVSGFYEWNHGKEKYYFHLQNEKVLYLGGIMDEFQGEKCFTILTREADVIMEPIHNRMPVVIAAEAADTWLSSLQDAKQIVRKPQPALKAQLASGHTISTQPEYEQIHIFNTFDL